MVGGDDRAPDQFLKEVLDVWKRQFEVLAVGPPERLVGY
jgi:hypothetical protein